MAYKVHIFWSDDEQDRAYLKTASECAEYILREEARVGVEMDYPKGISIVYATISEEEQS